MMFKKLKS